MKYRRKKMQLYNRAVWGQYYRHTLPRLCYGLTQDVKQSIHEELAEALNNQEEIVL